jgi:signal transduction histidine kinase/CheY-like chemotaxis protein
MIIGLFFFIPYALETIIPYQLNPLETKEIKNSILIFVFATSAIIISFLLKLISYNEKQLKKEIKNKLQEQLLIQQDLDKERIFNQIIFDNQDEILFISSFEKGIININQKFFRVFDYKDFDDFKNKHLCICELFIFKEGYLEMKPKGGYWSDEILENPKAIHKALMQDKYANARIFRVRLKEITVAEKKYHITTFSNITELEKARELAESSEKEKASFMANMSHELRTPLNGINGFAELLSKTSLTPKQQQYLSLINTSSSNLLGIVNDILDFSKIASGKMTLNCIEVDPFIEFNNILNLFRIKTEEKHIHYNIDIDTNIPNLIKIDTLRISQLFSNLIGNAIKFTPKFGSIDVRIDFLSQDEHCTQLKFSVKDSGIGIAKNRQQSIFEAFTQADESTTREFGGTGLGLSISVSLVHLMGGKLELQSTEGKGSTFSFTVKLKNVQHNKRLSTTNKNGIDEKIHTSNKSLKKSKVLVVEDNEMNQILMEELLKQQGIVAEFVMNGLAAIKKINQSPYDLIFMDINMPIMNGIETTQNIRNNNNSVPIIALTANALENDEAYYLQVGFNDYISKPIAHNLFVSIIEKYLHE